MARQPERNPRLAQQTAGQDNSAAQAQVQGFGFGNLISNFFAEQPPTDTGGEQREIQQEPEISESYKPSLRFKDKFAGKSVLLTGATGAVGSAVARKLLKCGLRKLVLFVRDREDFQASGMEQYAEQVAEPGTLHVETLDLREPQRIEQKFNSAMMAFGGVIDTLILCHGVVVQKGLITSTIPQFDQSMLVNVRSMMHLTSLAVPFLKVQPKSSITILTSSQGTKPDPKSPVMSIASAMVQQMIKCTALETAFHGVRINGVATGVINSKTRTNQQDLIAMKLTEEENRSYLEEAARDIPLAGQLNSPKEIAETILFLASDDASFCTGEIMVVDGGQSLTTDSYEDYCAMLKSVYIDQ